MSKFEKFLAEKNDFGANTGFAPLSLPDTLFDFQAHLADWIIRKGRGAVFADCGMGKTLIQLVWADNVVRKTNKPVLLLTPLSVSIQTAREAQKFGIDATVAIPGNPINSKIHISNYERLHYFDANDYAGIVCDESSILKNYDGVYKAEITEFMRKVPYRSLFTATAAPNDWEELGTSSEALGYLGYTDMLSRFFTNKSKTVKGRQFQNQRDKFYLRSYAEQDFWRWVSSWARAARMPSDLGFSDNGFVLPILTENNVEVGATRPPDGMLFDVEATNWFEEREAIRRTIPERCEQASELAIANKISVIWCHLNDEGTMLEKITPNSVQVSGKDSLEKKEEAIEWFVNGTDENRVLISKPDILGFGMNFQHCAHSVYFPTHSYEKYYQAIRRFWRFGQARPVTIDRVFTNGGRRMLDNVERKSKQADEMFDQLIGHINDTLELKNVYQPKIIGVPKWLTK